MNVQFLKEISEAYVIDSDLDRTPEQIFEDLYDIVKFLQEYDLPVYNELYDTTSLRQQRILKNYLDSIYEQELVTESLTVTATISGSVLLASVVTVLMGKHFLRTVYRVLSSVGSFFESFGKKLSNTGKYWQIKCAIIYENTRKCYSHCGIKRPKDISVLAPHSVKSSASVGTASSIMQARCLRECYIDELIDLIALHMESYFACLKRTGSFEAVQKTDSDDIIRMISSTNISAVCESFYNAAREVMDNFYRTLELVYDARFEESIRAEKINRLRSKVYEARKIVQKANEKEMKRYDSGVFPAKTAQKQNVQSQVTRTQIGAHHFDSNFRRN